MNKTNLFWPIYKNIEKEIIELSNQIHFDDNQLSIYSIKIAELILRCAVEIEAISKELYFNNGGKDKETLFFDTDCIDLLETKWQLSNKQVLITAANFYFHHFENKNLYPFLKANKRGTSGADWKKAYQAIKHNRTKDLKRANIKNLIRISAALFLLNLYYRNDVFQLGNSNTNNFTYTLSDIFDVKVHKWSGGGFDKMNLYHKQNNFNECVYLIKHTNKYHEKFLKYGEDINKKLNESIFGHPNVTKYINDNFILANGVVKKEEFDNFIKNGDFLKCFDMKTEYENMIQQATKFASNKLKFDIRTNEFEAVLNNKQEIYEILANVSS